MHKLKTNLNCGKCVAAISQAMDAHPDVERWSVATDVPQKWLTVEGNVSEPEIRSIVTSAGFKVLDSATSDLGASGHGTSGAADDSAASWLTTYRPLLLIVGYLLGTILLCEFIAPPFQTMRAMRHFMAGFFLVFSFFKMLDVSGFASSFKGYDIVASAFPPYAFAYPFVELSLGIAYLLNLNVWLTNVATAIVMFVGIIGVTRVLLQKRTIQCACLGSVFNLPMSYVTFVENGVMIVMACAMLAMYGVGG